MAMVKIWFSDLNGECQGFLRKQIEQELLEDKEYEWENEWETLYTDKMGNATWIDQDDYVDKKRDEFMDNGYEEAVDDYINRNDDGIEFII